MVKTLSIEYCVPCQFEKNARDLAALIQEQFSLMDENIELIPSNKIGTFEVIINGELIYSKSESGRLPRPDEIIELILLNQRG